MMTASELCADPFFQEWVFHPLGPIRDFFLNMFNEHSADSMQLQIAQARLLSYLGECQFISKVTEQYMVMKAVLEKEPRTESCFITILDYWNTIREQLIGHQFACNEHEIQFFKVIKPLFTSEREYLSLRYQAELFAGEDDKFWQRQPLRLEKFMNENAGFIEAYTTGETSHDEWWYCRGEHNDQTTHDHLIASYLGMVRYLHYVKQRLQNKGIPGDLSS